MAPTPFSELAALSRALEVTRKRKEKTRLLAEFLRSLEPEEVGPAVLLVVGSVFPEFDSRALEVGWRTVKGALEGSKQTTLFSEPLTIMRVYVTLERIAEAEGSGSRRVKTGLIQGLLRRCASGSTRG
jgi:DNA ligase-1